MEYFAYENVIEWFSSERKEDGKLYIDTLIEKIEELESTEDKLLAELKDLRELRDLVDRLPFASNTWEKDVDIIKCYT